VLDLEAQEILSGDTRAEVFPSSEVENYLRTLQTEGKVPLYPWSLRNFSVAEIDRLFPTDSSHPWSARIRSWADRPTGVQIGVVRPEVRAYYNSGFPYGEDDGAVWAGRGLTTAIRAGAAIRYRGISARLAPVLFRAENGDFPLFPNGHRDQRQYAYWIGTGIDYPQRFGDGAYTRLDPGESFVRVDASIFSIEASTGAQQWGPGHTYPIILSGNAPGFPHLAVGTSRPVNLGFGRVHTRMMWGRLSPSAYALAPPDSQVRFAAGLTAVLVPRWLDGVELGFTRFFHSPWPEEGLADAPFGLPIQALLKNKFANSGEGATPRVQDQLASIYVRGVLPGAGAEVYAEYAREDHSFNTRDLILELDHTSAYMVGLRKTWGAADRLSALRVEFLSSRPANLDVVRHQGFFYTHTNQLGHTQRGQILGSPAALGGAGAEVALDRFDRSGRWSLSFRRQIRADLAEWTKSEEEVARSVDALYSLGAERLLFRGRSDLLAGFTGVYNLNRDFERDAFNLRLTLGARVGL
jgi:hypothetical protein